MGKKKATERTPVRVAVKDLPTIRIDELVPYANNAKIHGPDQIEQLRRSLRQFGFVSPVLIDEDRNLIAGHGRVEAARAEGMTEVPYVTVSDLTEAQRRAYIIADNRLTEAGVWDAGRLKLEMQELQALKFDTELTGFAMPEVETISVSAYEQSSQGVSNEPHGYHLRDLFLCNPFSVIDCKAAEWQARKRLWLDFGICGEDGRKTNLSGACDAPDYIDGTCDKMAPGTSIFDPALCELMYSWFCPCGGSILDPFAGGSTRGIVAGALGHPYCGIDLRQEQIAANEANASQVDIPIKPRWVCGDSRNVLDRIAGGPYDMIFSCPPYADLEVYSDDPADLSNMPYDEFLAAYREIIARSCGLLKADRFAVFVVGDVRDTRGFYRDLISDTKRAFIDCGVSLYNEIIKLDPFGTAGARARRVFSTRKVVRVHQHILVFYKGDPRRIRDQLGEIQIPDITGSDSD